MKMVQVEIISEQKIKPSSPTPSHLRVFKLSLLDQLIPAPYAPIILFYHHQPSSGVIDDDEDVTAAADEMTAIRWQLDLLKTSLAQTLSGFYPLAGEINDEVSIQCNDKGADYVEARVKYSTLDEFLSRPDLLVLHKFLPCDVTNNAKSPSVTNIQVNVFKCGGIAIGICVSHKMLDGAALSTFLKAWTANARNLRGSTVNLGSSLSLSLSRSSSALSSSSSDNSDNNSHSSSSDSDDQALLLQQPQAASNISTLLIKPNLFAASSLFPAKDDFWLRDSSTEMWGSLLIKYPKSSCVTKRFVFDASAIAALKHKVISVANDKPTRVEVVSGFIWQCAMAASKQIHGFQRPSVLTHLVNLRSRLRIPNDSTGNLLWIAAATWRPTAMLLDDEEQEVAPSAALKGLVGELRNAFSKIDGEFVKKMRWGGDEERKCVMMESLKELRSAGGGDVGCPTKSLSSDYYGFSSWCNFGFYEDGDFGWGKPIWVTSIASTGNSVFLNLVIMVDTRSGDGIEAWVTLDQHHMALLQSNLQLQKLASFDPSPLLLLP